MLMLLLSVLQLNIFSIFQAQAANIESTHLSMRVQNATIVQVFKEIEKKTSFHFSYNDAFVNENLRVSLTIENKKLSDVLSFLEKEAHLQFKQVRGSIHVLTLDTPTANTANPIRISGKVVSAEDNSPLVGASIRVKGTNKGTVADANGDFKLEVEEANATLEISSVGYLKQEIKVNGRNLLNVALSSNISSLDEVVVVGYGTQKVKDLTGSVGVVKVDNAKKTASYDVAKMLQGQVAGVTVTGSGEPGGYVAIRIRGTGSLQKSDPLFVIDGVPVDSPFDFAPGDIESIQVLKDASSGAIYGSRAANGVVIITTKKGKNGPLKVDYNGYFGVSEIARTIPVTNRVGYQKITTAAELNDLNTVSKGIAPANDPSNPLFINNIDTDWQKVGFKTGYIQDHNVSLSGGTDAFRGSVGLGYFDQSSTYTGPQNYTRYTLNGNMTGKRGIFTYGIKTAFTHSLKVNNANTREHAVFGGGVASLLTAIPTMPVYDATRNGGFGGADKNIHRAITLNVVGMNSLLESTSERNRLLGNAWGEFAITKDLKYKLSLSYDRTDWFDFFFEPDYDLGFYYLTQQAYLSNVRGAASTMLAENTLNFSKEFGKHKIDVLGGYTVQKNQGNNLFASALGLTKPYFKVLSSSVETTGGKGVAQGQDANTLLSTLGRINYNYADKYLITFNARRDGSSFFIPENRWDNFYSVAGAWNVEKDIQLPTVINRLKLRAGYGELGNQAILGSPYQVYSYINSNVNVVFNNALVNGATTTQRLADQNLRWERRESINIGTDIGLLNDKIGLTVEYYDNTSRNVLVRIPISPSLGLTNGDILTNFGSINNKGVEITASYRKKEGDFKYEVSANAQTLKNTVLELANNTPIYGAASITKVGGSLGEIYGYLTDGIFQNADEVKNHATQTNAAPGDIRFKDINGDGAISADDRVSLGNSIPTFYYGLNFNASYKNFDFSLFAQGHMGNKVFNGVYRDLMGGQYGNHHVDELNFWTPTNTNTNVPRPVIGDPNANGRDSDRFVESGAYMRLQNAQLGYTVPENIAKKVGATRIRAYVSGQNIFMITKYKGYDPDFMPGDANIARGFDYGSYPNPRTIMMGLQLGF